MIISSKYFKLFSIIFKLSLIASIILCLILKYWKTSQLNSLEEDDDSKNLVDESEKVDVKNESNQQDLKINANDSNSSTSTSASTSIKHSEEGYNLYK
jgi:hypothetical protein